ncbi:DUF2959 domain-containing protein [Vibrio chagasii]|nr:DUF2959 domain-containing protein [Vibrio chagasii]
MKHNLNASAVGSLQGEVYEPRKRHRVRDQTDECSDCRVG